MRNKDLTISPFISHKTKDGAEMRDYSGRVTTKFVKPHLTNKDIIMKTSSLDILCATDEEEFYYEGSEEPVPEGEPVGIDIDTSNGVELVLFANIYWQPSE